MRANVLAAFLGLALCVTPSAFAGDAKQGETKSAVCAACHGMDGNSNAPANPNLAGQHESYIARQLALYKSGERQHPVMQPFAVPLSEQDMADIGAFFATKSAKAGLADDKLYPAGEVLYIAGDMKRGLPACMACHGPSGRGNPGSMYPALTGQRADYLKAQLQFFRQGGAWGKETRENRVMSAIASQLSDTEIEALATYLEGLQPR